MKAIVMAGGEGSRLRPLTLERPKPMITLASAPALEHILRLLRRHGFTDVLVTLHYLGSVIEDYFGEGEDLGLRITYTHEDRPLGTAGSVALARASLTEPFLVISGDALTDVDLSAFIKFHQDNRAQASLLVYRVPNPLEYGVVVTDESNRIERFQEKPSWGEVLSDTVNTGIYALDPAVFSFVPEGRSIDFSLDVFPRMLADKRPLYGFVADGYWTDVGTLDAYREASADLVSGKVDVGDTHAFRPGNPTIVDSAVVHPSAQIHGSVYVGRGCDVRAGAVITGPAAIGDYSVVDERAEVRESFLLGNGFVGPDARLDRCIVGRQAHIGRGVTVGQAAVVGDGATLGASASLRAGVRVWPRKYVDEGVVLDRSLIHGGEARRTIFSHGGVAGLANVELTPEFAARLGAAWGSSLTRGGSVVASRDPSRPARMVKRAHMAGLASVGIRVIDVGAVPFPVARFATRLFDAAGCTHVRTSPYETGSLDVRFLDAQGIDLRKADERKIETLYAREDFRRVGSPSIGEITTASPLEAYADALFGMVASEESEPGALGIVADYMAGGCGEVLPGLLARLGIRDTAIDASPGEVEPATGDVEARLARLGRIVPAVDAVCGVLLDSDGNRVWIVDERGRPLSQLQAVALVLRLLRDGGRLGSVALPFTLPNSLLAYASALGFEPVRTQANTPALMRAARDSGCVFAANGRDAYFFPTVHPGPDAMATAVFTAQGLCARGAAISRIVHGLPAFNVVSTEVPVPWERRGSVMRALNEHETYVDEGELDGVVLSTGPERAVVLPDVDRPVFQIVAEGPTNASARELGERVGALITAVLD